MLDTIEREVLNLKEEMLSLRRDFHLHPELGMQEVHTARVIAEYLENLGLTVTAHIGKTGLLEGSLPVRTVLLRADMDALPIHEKTALPF